MPSFDTLKRWVQGDWAAHKEWREIARDDFRFIAGEQWTEEEQQMLHDQMRVPIVFNRAATIINSVAGSEINNRTEVRFFPRTLGDAKMNEVLSKGAEWFRDQGGAEEEESQGFQDALVCGMGWTETLLDFEEDTDGQPQMERINPLEMCWDGAAERRCLTDARRIARVREWDWEEARDMFPDADEESLSAKWLDTDKDDVEPTRQWSDDDYNHVTDEDDVTDERQPKAVIVQLQYCERRRFVEYADPLTGQRKEVTRGQFKRLMELAEQAGFTPKIDYRDIRRKEWRQVFLGADILEENQPCKPRSTFQPITGYWDNDKRQWFGLLRTMKDPQKYANKWLSQALHIINSNSKGGILVEEGATDDMRELEENWSAADGVIQLRQGGLAKIKEKTMGGIPPALMSLTEFAISSIRDVSGVNMELLGMRDENQPGILEYQRKQAAMTTLAVLFDALRQYRKEQAEVMLFYMTEHLADGRLVRISDDQGERYEPLQIDESVRKYDVIVDDAPSAPNNKERVWETIKELFPILAQAGLPKEIWGEIVEYAPFPAQLIEKLREYAKQPDQPDPMAEQAKVATLQKLLAEVEAAKAEGEKDRANAFENIAQGIAALAKAEAEPQMAQYEIAKDVAQAQAAHVKAGADIQKAGTDVTKSQLDLVGKILDLNRPAQQPAQ